MLGAKQEAMPTARISREELLNRLTQAFREFGYHGASIAELSAATGLGKASLYHAFSGGKQEMAEAVLDHVSARFDASVIECLRGDAPVRQRLTAMAMALSDFYDKGESSCVFELFSVGSAGETFAPRLLRAFQSFETALRDVAIQAGLEKREASRRAGEVVVSVQGALVVARGTGKPAVFKRTLAALPDQLLD